jgi:hypothetical protein
MNAVSFCTPEYERFVPLWEAACEKHGFAPHVIRRPSRGGYDGNTNLKPGAILEACDTVGEFAYFDIDCIPTGPFDFSLPRCIGTVKSVHPTHKCKIASSLLFVGAKGRPLIERWKILCDADPTRRDHPLLIQAISECGKKMNIRDMTRYCAGKWAFNALNPEKVTFES